MKAAYGQQQYAASSTIIQQAFSWMFGGLLVTAGTSIVAASSQPFQQALLSSPILMIGLILAELALVFVLSATINTLARPVAVALFLVYALLNGVTLSSIFMIYSGVTIGAAFVSASLMFGIMAVFGYVTKKDLSGWGSIAFMGLIGVIIASLINFFLRSNMLMLLLSYAAIAVFTVLTAYDTQKLKQMSESMDGGNLGIYGALRLYLDFINIFLSLLRIFGNQRN